MEDKIIRKSKNNDQPVFIKLGCVNCGASLEMVDKGRALCKYCGQRYLVDEAEGRLIVDLTVKHSSQDEQTKQALKKVMIALGVFLVVTLIVVAKILSYNAPKEESKVVESTEESEEVFLSEDEEIRMLVCEEIFGKEYAEITPEDFASVKFLEYNYNEASKGINELNYSFMDYRDCADEEAFQETIQSLSHKGEKMSMDFSAFTGLTRVDATNSENLSQMIFAQEVPITYLSTDEPLEKVGQVISLESIEVLNMSIFYDLHTMEGMAECVNLKELYVEADLRYSGEAVDMSLFAENTKLEKITLKCGNESYINLDAMGKLTNLKEFYLEQVTLEDCTFLDKLTNLERLSLWAPDYFDTGFLKSLPNLKALHFSGGGYLTAEDIAGLTNVEELTIKVDNPAALEAVTKLPKLRELDIYTNDDLCEEWNKNVTDISILSQMPALEKLAIEGSWYIGVEHVLKHPTLQEVSISGFEVYPELLQVNESITEVYFGSLPKHPDTRERIGDEVFLEVFPNVEVFQVELRY